MEQRNPELTPLSPLFVQSCVKINTTAILYVCVEHHSLQSTFTFIISHGHCDVNQAGIVILIL